MVASAMVAQDQNEGNGSEIIVPASSRLSLDDYAPKVRKPYTISKQRERWTEDEHKKFIEALQLYGRAWRRIEEHVGTKTAVQIRSHAQKFFSKVVRESNCGDTSSEKPIEIPPPRPKRKPMHPYPRKLASPTKSSNPGAEKPARSASPSPSIMEQESRSPTSVLSAIGSDTLGISDSSTVNGSLSPVSTSTRVNASPNIDEEAAKELLLFCQDSRFSKETSVEATYSSRCLKLFGKTMLVTGSHRPSTPMGTCKADPVDVTDNGPTKQTLSLNYTSAKFSSGDYDSSFGAYSSAAPASLCYMPVQNDGLSNIEIPLPWWKLCGGASFPSPQVYSPTPIKPPVSDNTEQDKDAQKEGSSTGSNTESVSLDGDGDRKPEVGSQSLGFSLGKEKQEKVWPSRPNNKTGFSEHRAISFKNNSKGFVPYKRCLADRDARSSKISSEERNGQQLLRLCL